MARGVHRERVQLVEADAVLPARPQGPGGRRSPRTPRRGSGQPNRASIARSVSRWPPDAAGSISTAPSGVHCTLPFQRSPWMRAGGSPSSRSPEASRSHASRTSAQVGAADRRRAPPPARRRAAPAGPRRRRPRRGQPSGRVGRAWFADERRAASTPPAAPRTPRRPRRASSRAPRRTRPRPPGSGARPARAPRGRSARAPRRAPGRPRAARLREPAEAGRLRLEEPGRRVRAALRVDPGHGREGRSASCRAPVPPPRAAPGAEARSGERRASP